MHPRVGRPAVADGDRRPVPERHRQLRATGGDVIPSLGGWSADQGGTEIADSCRAWPIAAAYEKLITTYNVSRLDMDIEGRSLTNSAGIDRRNKAIKLLQDWAAENGRNVQIQYTLPTSANGLGSSELPCCRTRSATARASTWSTSWRSTTTTTSRPTWPPRRRARPGARPAAEAIAGQDQRAALGHAGVTMMPGVDDYPSDRGHRPGRRQQLLTFAEQGHEHPVVWAIQRDNGGCPGGRAANDCSGIAQDTWDFSHAMEPFTR